MERAQRKLEHIKYALELGDGPRSTHFEDIRFLHNCLPEINPADIILSVKVLELFVISSNIVSNCLDISFNSSSERLA